MMQVGSTELMWIAGALGALIFTLVSCTAAIIIFLWKKFDAVYDQIEEIKIHQGTEFVKHDICKNRTKDTKIDLGKDIKIAIKEHEDEHHN